MTAKELLSALANEDHARLSGTPASVKKTAERLIIEFRGSALLSSSGADFGVIRDDDVEQALTSLGYKKDEIKRALTAMPPDATDTAVKVRAALRFLAGK